MACVSMLRIRGTGCITHFGLLFEGGSERAKCGSKMGGEMACFPMLRVSKVAAARF